MCTKRASNAGMLQGVLAGSGRGRCSTYKPKMKADAMQSRRAQRQRHGRRRRRQQRCRRCKGIGQKTPSARACRAQRRRCHRADVAATAGRRCLKVFAARMSALNAKRVAVDFVCKDICAPASSAQRRRQPCQRAYAYYERVVCAARCVPARRAKANIIASKRSTICAPLFAD